MDFSGVAIMPYLTQHPGMGMGRCVEIFFSCLVIADFNSILTTSQVELPAAENPSDSSMLRAPNVRCFFLVRVVTSNVKSTALAAADAL